MELPIKPEIAQEHLGRTGAGTPPPSAPSMLSHTAMEVLRQPSVSGSRVGSPKATFPTRVSTSRLMKKRPQPVAHTQSGFCPPSQMAIGDSSSSSALPASWRRTWSGVGAFPSPTLRRQEEAVGPERDLSTPARRANQKAELTMKQYATAQQFTASRQMGGGAFMTEPMGQEAFGRTTSSSQPPPNIVDSKEMAQAFKEGVAEVESSLFALTSSLSSGVKDSKTRAMEQANREREEAKRRQAAEEREARLKEAEARDPHKKVHLRLENTRKFNLDEAVQGVPMQQVTFSGHQGTDMVNMVDVTSIRRKCKHMDGLTPSVRDLLEDQTRRDRLFGLDPKTGKPKSASTGNLQDSLASPDHQKEDDASAAKAKLGSPSKRIAVAHRPLNLGLDEEKRAQIQTAKSQAYIATMLGRLNTMRSDPTENTLCNLEQIAAQVHIHHARHQKLVEQNAQKTGDLSKRASVAVGEGTRDSIPVGGMDSRASLLATQDFAASIRVARKNLAGAPAVKDAPKARRQQKPLQAMDPKAQQRARHRWNIVRYAVFCHYLYFYCKKKQAAIEKVKGFLNIFGEWARLRLSMTRLTSNISILQRGCRRFLDNKRKRCDMMANQWQRVENKHLAIQFKALAHQALEEQALKEAGAVEGSVKAQLTLKKQKSSAIRNMMLDNMDWKVYKIPDQDRRATLSRFYMVSLKKQISNKQNLYVILQDVVRRHNETVGFLRKFGADAENARDHARDLRSMALGPPQAASKAPADFWKLSEEKTLDLIAYAASQKRQTPPFHNHPAFFDRPDNHMYRPDQEISGMMSGADLRNAKFKKKAAGPVDATKPLEEKEQADAPVDAEQLWENFTPRLRELADRPESRMSERPSSRPGLGEQDKVAWRLG